MLLPKKGEDKINYLLNADVFVLPSYEEGDSIALKEAMSAENAVIISEQCRLNLVSEKNAGFIIKTDKDSLKNALLLLWKNVREATKKTGKKLHNSCELSPKMENPLPLFHNKFSRFRNLKIDVFFAIIKCL